MASGNLQRTLSFSGSKSIMRTGQGNNQHYFINSKNPHQFFQKKDEFFAYVYLDPKNPPKQIMLQFNDGSWSSIVPTGGNPSYPMAEKIPQARVKMGPLPELGKWVRLVSQQRRKSASNQKLKVNGIAFTQWDGTTLLGQGGRS